MNTGSKAKSCFIGYELVAELRLPENLPNLCWEYLTKILLINGLINLNGNLD